MITLKIRQMQINGHPYLCPECASEAFTLDGNGFIDALPVTGNCWMSHSWDEPLITLGALKQINAVRTGRQRVDDEDTFEIVIGGAVLTGTLHPDVTAADLKAAGRIYWTRLIKPALRRQKRKAVRAAKRPAKKAVAAAKAAALSAAWDLQAGGHETNPDYQPSPIDPCPACEGDGYFDIDSHLHATTRIRCAVCRGTGEAD